ncbi:hypothetical protein [Magnetovibrio sp.]|uniref:hypothetical protein n=1 Tax=Magnetovibrio sp. TaxID=2024836 RepID=UPI002F92714D
MPEREDPRSPEETLKAQRTMVFIFGFATLMPTLWMVMMSSNGITLGQGSDAFASVLIYWGLAAPVVWLLANGLALKKIAANDGEGARYYPLVPAFWAIIWFAAQVGG